MISPAIESDPGFGRVVRDGMVLSELRSGRAGVVRKYPKSCADRKALADRQGGGVRRGQDSVLLVCRDHDDALDRVALQIADDSVSIIVRLTGGAAIAAHGHPSGIHDDPAFVVLMADH